MAANDGESTEWRIGVLGAGAFGTALAQTFAHNGRSTEIWARNPAIAEEINRDHSNRVYLPGVELAHTLHATSDLGRVRTYDIILLVTPAQTTRSMMQALRPFVRDGIPIVICSKGLEQATGIQLSRIVENELPQARVAVLSGPGFAAEIARGLPTALTLACPDRVLGQALSTALGTRTFRLYWTDDVAGVELGGAVKNVLAIAAGIAAGRKLGAGAHAALVTRGFAELRRIGAALGARPETLVGLSGLGDLVLTTGSQMSRNMSLGIALAEGRTLAEILGSRRSVSEGVATASAVDGLARHLQLDMPIARAVHDICAGNITVDDALEMLLSRPFKPED